MDINDRFLSHDFDKAPDERDSWWQGGNHLCSILVEEHDIGVRFHTDWLHDQDELVEAFHQVVQLVDERGDCNITLDFTNVGNLSSMAIGEIFALWRALEGSGALRIANCKACVMATLRVVHLHLKCHIQSADETLVS